MTQAQWLTHAANPVVQSKIISDPVLPFYGDISAQFNLWTPMTWSNAIVGLHVIYAWMPTIPDLHYPAALNPAGRANVVSLLNAARARSLTVPEIAFLKENFTNNSVVGLSKLLHFIAPDRYAIWDSRVAIVWYQPNTRPPYSTWTSPAAYEHYLQALAGWAPAAVNQAILSVRAISPSLAPVSNLRVIELVMFHA